MAGIFYFAAYMEAACYLERVFYGFSPSLFLLYT